MITRQRALYRLSLSTKKNRKSKFSDRMIKQLLDLVIAKYRDLSVSRNLVMPRQIISLLATDKSRYFAQTRPIIVYYFNILSFSFYR